MAKCLVKDSKYQTLLTKSGIDESIFHAVYGAYLDEHEGVPNHETPNLDELPNSNSSKYLADTLHINENNSATVSDILTTAQASTIEEANIKLNNEYSDLEIDLLPLNNEALVRVLQRPSNYELHKKDNINISDANINTGVLFSSMFDKLRKLYGINIINITSKELAQDSWKDVPDVQSSSAFIYNGNIYINTDYADVDAPIHEMTHILLGAVRFKNPDFYSALVQMADKFKNFNQIASNYPNRALSDIYEEVFVLEVSRYLSGLKSDIDSLNDKFKYELHYNMKRLLDSVLMGEYSVKSIEDDKLYNMSLRDLANKLNSSLLVHTIATGLDDARKNRMLANVKSELMKKGDLREEC